MFRGVKEVVVAVSRFAVEANRLIFHVNIAIYTYMCVDILPINVTNA